jgi:hypothetical protein
MNRPASPLLQPTPNWATCRWPTSSLSLPHRRVDPACQHPPFPIPGVGALLAARHMNLARPCHAKPLSGARPLPPLVSPVCAAFGAVQPLSAGPMPCLSHCTHPLAATSAPSASCLDKRGPDKALLTSALPNASPLPRPTGATLAAPTSPSHWPRQRQWQIARASSPSDESTEPNRPNRPNRAPSI